MSSRFIIEVAGDFSLKEMERVLLGVPTLRIVQSTIADTALRDKARAMYAKGSNDDIEIDDEPETSETGADGDDGVWVAAWVFVRPQD